MPKYRHWSTSHYGRIIPDSLRAGENFAAYDLSLNRLRARSAREKRPALNKNVVVKLLVAAIRCAASSSQLDTSNTKLSLENRGFHEAINFTVLSLSGNAIAFGHPKVQTRNPTNVPRVPNAFGGHDLGERMILARDFDKSVGTGHVPLVYFLAWRVYSHVRANSADSFFKPRSWPRLDLDYGIRSNCCHSRAIGTSISRLLRDVFLIVVIFS